MDHTQGSALTDWKQGVVPGKMSNCTGISHLPTQLLGEMFCATKEKEIC